MVGELAKAENNGFAFELSEEETEHASSPAALRAGRDVTGGAELTRDVAAINDAHGHQAGGRVLMQVAMSLRRSVRNVDTAARLAATSRRSPSRWASSPHPSTATTPRPRTAPKWPKKQSPGD